VSGLAELNEEFEGFFLPQLLIQSDPGILKLLPVWQPVNVRAVTVNATTKYVANRGRLLRMTTRPFGKREIRKRRRRPNRSFGQPNGPLFPLTLLSTGKRDVWNFRSVFT